MPTAFERLAAPPLFVTGDGRSGTSITFDLLASHPEVCALFETWLLMPQSGITGIFHQPQWNAPFYEHQRGKIGHDHAAVQLVGYAEAARQLGDLLAQWLIRGLEPQHRYLVEKTPLEVEALAALFPEARLIHMVRDGRDVVGSVRAAGASWAPEMAGLDSIASASSRWSRRVQELRRGKELLGGHYLELRFENARADPAAFARRLFEFGQMEFDEATVERAIGATETSAYSEGSRRSGFRGTGRVGGWHGWMTRDAGREFDKGAGELLVELGYAPDRDWWRNLPRRRA